MTKKLYEHATDEKMDLFLLIKSADVRTTKNGKTFIAFTFQDLSGQMDGKFWNASAEDVERYQAGEVVKLSGKREVYQGNPQVRINALRLAEEGEPINKESYIEQAPLKKENMTETINEAIFEITNANMNRIVRYILNKYQQDFFQMPAAKKLHHAFAGGLAFHTVSMLNIARMLCGQYEELNKSLLYSGLILHDLGKVMELSGVASTEYTLEGNLVGHIVIVYEEIAKACDALKIDGKHEDVLLLKHMVLAHHGHLEYGSPVRPKVMEAEVLFMIDNMDASINMMTQALNRTEPGQFTERLFGLDNRTFYHPQLSSQSDLNLD